MFQANKKNSLILESKTNIMQYLEALGDILSHQVIKRINYEHIADCTEKLENLLKRFFEIKEKNPILFEKLIFSNEFSTIIEKDSDKAQNILRYSSDIDKERILVIPAAFLNLLIKLHQSSKESNNKEVERLISRTLVRVLISFLQYSDNEIFINQILSKIHEINVALFKEKYLSSSDFLLLNWYSHVVLSYSSKINKVNLIKSLNILNSYFLLVVIEAIEQGKKEIFEKIISDIVLYTGSNVNRIDTSHVFALWQSIPYSTRVNNRMNDELSSIALRLDSKLDIISSEEELDTWLNEFENFKKAALSLIHENDYIPSFIEKCDDIQEQTYYSLILNNIYELTFHIGAYCLLDEKYEYIKYIWERKQPNDADATWGGNNIYPEKINELIVFHFSKPSFKREPKVWKDRRGSEYYYKKYFILLLSRLLQFTRDEYYTSDSYLSNGLKSIDIFRLTEMEHFLEGYINLSKKLKSDSKLLNGLNLTENAINKCSELLISLKNLSKNEEYKRIENKQISKNKIQQFTIGIIETFNNNAVFRGILNEYGKVSKKLDEKLKPNAEGLIFEKAALNVVVEKEKFFDDWYVSYSEPGVSEGLYLAAQEDINIYMKLVSKCTKVNKNDFDSIFTNAKNIQDLIIVSSSIGVYNFLVKDIKREIIKENPLEIPGFYGYYLYNNFKIPIFKLTNQIPSNFLIVLKKSTLGELIQLSPISKEEEKEGIVDAIFYMLIEECSKKEEIYLQNPPAWLSNFSDNIQEQKEYLKRFVHFMVRERFEFKLPKDFEGYYIQLRD